MNQNLISNLSIMPNYDNRLPEVGDILLQLKQTSTPKRYAGSLVTVNKITDTYMFFINDNSNRWTRQPSRYDYYVLLSTIPYSSKYKYYIENNEIYSIADRIPEAENVRSINLLRTNTIAYFYKQDLLFIENPTLYDVLDIKFDNDKIYYIDGMNQTQGFDSILELLSTRIQNAPTI